MINMVASIPDWELAFTSLFYGSIMWLIPWVALGIVILIVGVIIVIGVTIITAVFQLFLQLLGLLIRYIWIWAPLAALAYYGYKGVSYVLGL